MKMATWMENHRAGIATVLDAISTVIWLISLFGVRILAGAGAILAYFFFTASPDTTVYQLSQMTHLGVFWQGALCIAIIYSVFLAAIQGSISGGRSRSVRACDVTQYAVGSMKSPNKQ